MTIDYERLAAIRTRASAATPGPWNACGEDAPEKWPEGACSCGAVYGDSMRTIVGKLYDVSDHREMETTDLPTPHQRAGNALLVAHARDDVPFLLDTIDALLAPHCWCGKAIPTDGYADEALCYGPDGTWPKHAHQTPQQMRDWVAEPTDAVVKQIAAIVQDTEWPTKDFVEDARTAIKAWQEAMQEGAQQ